MDDFSWTISDDDCNMTTMTASSSALETRNSVRRNQITTSGLLRFIGGVDLSFGLQDPNVACAALVVLDISTLEVVYESFECVLLTEPYIPGFLAFREVCFHCLCVWPVFLVVMPAFYFPVPFTIGTYSEAYKR